MKRWALLLCLSGCLVPTLGELETERERTCDADHPCLTGYMCLAEVCKRSGSVDCGPGDTQACGQLGGECLQGTQTCTAAGAWGECLGAIGPVTEACDGKDNDCDGTTDEGVMTPSCGVDAGVCAGKVKACVSGTLELSCSAASFGATYETAEATCDGLDNDCDGLTDETLPPQPCDKTLGACAGATRTCTAGALPTCSAAAYLANDAGYEPLETSCDGRDNDCDGLTDSWAARLVTDGGTPTRRKVAAVVQPGTGTSVRRDVLALYEEGARVTSVVISASGTVSSPRFPALTIPSVAKASSPALGTDGTDVAEAWFEELSGPPALFRLMVALAGPTGEAIVNGSPGALPTTMPGPGQEVVVGLTPTRIVLAWSRLDAPTGTASSVEVASCPKQLSASCTTRSLGAGRNPSLLISGDDALVVYETGSRLSLAKVAVPSGGTVTVTSNLAFGGSSEHDAVLVGTVASLDIYSVVPGTPETLWKRNGDCGTACDPTAFTSTPSLFTFAGTASGLKLERNGAAQLLAWEDGPIAMRVARVMTLSNTTPRDVSLAGATGRRPVPLVVGTAGFEVLFDTDDEIFSRRFCGP